MKKQLIVKSSNLQLVAMLSCAGYPYRFVAAEGNYLFEDSGDIDLMVEDFEKGAQGITDCRALLMTYEKLLAQTGGSAAPGPLDDFTPRPGTQSVSSRNVSVMAIWRMHGYALQITCASADGKFECVITDDGTAKRLMAKFRNGELRCDPLDYDKALFQVRSMLKAARRPQEQPFVPVSLSNADAQGIQ
jgi:hypothetical protein